MIVKITPNDKNNPIYLIIRHSDDTGAECQMDARPFDRADAERTVRMFQRAANIAGSAVTYRFIETLQPRKAGK